jgi:hypothetical protein
MKHRWYTVEADHSPTLQVRPPYSFSLAFSALFLFIFWVSAEIIVRVPEVQMALGTPHLGTAHKQFEQQWFRLTEYAASRGAVDCIFIGDSTVMTNFSPVPFAEAFRQGSGEEIDCFNFGVGALTAPGFDTLTQILSEQYEPRFLFVGVQALNFTVPYEEQGDANITDTSWARYKLGKFSMLGWLFNHSYLYRYSGSIGQLATFTANQNEVMLSQAGEIGGVVDGFFPMQGPGPFDISQPPDPNFDHPYIEHYFAVMETFQLLPENLEALDRVMSLDHPKTQIILVEMPVAETFKIFFKNDEQDYQLFINTIHARAAANQIPFLRMRDLRELPPETWFNYNHLNAAGAPIFSRWLGEELSQIVTTNRGQNQ